MIDPRYVAHVGLLLLAAGMALQFLMRQFKMIRDRWYWLVVILLVGLVYWLTCDLSVWRADPRMAAIMMAEWLVTACGTVRGGSGATGSLAQAVQAKANGALSTAPSVVQMMVPVTNSK